MPLETVELDGERIVACLRRSQRVPELPTARSSTTEPDRAADGPPAATRAHQPTTTPPLGRPDALAAGIIDETAEARRKTVPRVTRSGWERRSRPRATSLDSPSQLLPIGRQHCLAEYGRYASRPRGRSGSPTASTRSRSPRAALGHPDVPLAVEDPEAREIKLIVDHRETLVRQRTEAQDRLRWLLHAVDPEVSVSAGALDRKVWLDRVERRLARAQCIEVRVATGPRGPLSRADRRRQRARARDRGTRRTVRAPAPRPDGLWNAHRRKLIGETGGIGRVRTDAQLARLAGVAPLDASSGRQQRHRHGNRQLTPRCTNWPSSKAAGTRAPAPPSNAARPKARHDSTRCAASSDCWSARLPPPAPDTGNPSRARRQGPRRKGPSACACLSCRWSLRSRPADAPERVRHSAGRTQGPPQQQVGRRRQFSITAS
ncbi:MAG: transposase [Solirubrobacteraceae bacterium]